MKISKIEFIVIAVIFLLNGFGFLGVVSLNGAREIQILNNGISVKGIVIDQIRTWWSSAKQTHSVIRYRQRIEYNVDGRSYSFIAGGLGIPSIPNGTVVEIAYDRKYPERAIKNTVWYVYGRFIPKAFFSILLILVGLYILRKSQTVQGKGSSFINI